MKKVSVTKKPNKITTSFGKVKIITRKLSRDFGYKEKQRNRSLAQARHWINMDFSLGDNIACLQMEMVK